MRARRVERLGALVLSSEPLPAPTPDAARPLLLQLLRERGLRRALFGGDAAGKAHPALELVARVRLLRALAPEAGWPRWDEAGLLAAAEDEGGWLSPALQRSTSLKQLAAADLPSLLSQSLPYEMQVRLRGLGLGFGSGSGLGLGLGLGLGGCTGLQPASMMHGANSYTNTYICGAGAAA